MLLASYVLPKCRCLCEKCALHRNFAYYADTLCSMLLPSYYAQNNYAGTIDSSLYIPDCESFGMMTILRVSPLNLSVKIPFACQSLTASQISKSLLLPCI